MRADENADLDYLPLATRDDIYQQFLIAVDRRRLADSTRRQYKREIAKAAEANVDLRDAVALQAYADTLPPSSRAFLRSAVRAWSEHVARQVKSQATPDNVQQVQAAVYRLEALGDAIESETPSGTKAHLWLTRAEVQQLVTLPDLGKPSGLRDKVVLAVLVAAGLRRQEAVQLQWDAIKQQGSRTVLEVRGKGDKLRVVPISTALVALLHQWQEISIGFEDDRVLRRIYKGGKIGRSLTGAAVHGIVRKYGKLLGKPTLQPHDLRRTYAQIGLEAGVAIQQISQLLGHADIATTQRYLNLELDLNETVSDFVPIL